MGLDSFTYITSLNAANPVTGDSKTEGDDHLRGVKTTLLNSFPAIAGAVTPTHTELNYVDGVTSAIQTQLDAKGATITGGATTIVSSNLTVSRALVSDGSGKVAVATTTSAEIGFVNGLTSAVQTQLDAKLGNANWSFSSNRLVNGGNTQPSFRATTAAARTTDGIFATFTEQHDYGSNFDASTGIFTAPVAGIYAFAAQFGVSASSSAGNASFRILVDGSSVRSWVGNVFTYSQNFCVAISAIALTLSQQVKVDVTSSGTSSPTFDCWAFDGTLLR